MNLGKSNKWDRDSNTASEWMGTINSIPPRNISSLLFVQSQTYLPSLFVTVGPWRPSKFL